MKVFRILFRGNFDGGEALIAADNAEDALKVLLKQMNKDQSLESDASKEHSAIQEIGIKEGAEGLLLKYDNGGY